MIPGKCIAPSQTRAGKWPEGILLKPTAVTLPGPVPHSTSQIEGIVVVCGNHAKRHHSYQTGG